MKKIKLAIFAAAAVLSVANFAIGPIYIGVIIILGWRAYAAFVPLAGLLALPLIYFNGNTDQTLEEFIKQKIKGERIRNFLLKLFKGRIVAMIISALFLGPYLTPYVVNLCLKRRVYFWAILLNMLGTALWIFIYQGGAEIIKSLWEAAKLSI